MICAVLLIGTIGPLEGFYYILEPHLNVFVWLSIALALHGARHVDPSGSGRPWLWAMGAGFAAGAAFWTKQQGAVALPLAAALPSLSRGRVEIRTAIWTAGGFLVLPFSFFALHPDALKPAIEPMMALTKYAANRSYAVSDTWYGLRQWLCLIPLLAAGVVAAGFLISREDPADRRVGRVGLGLLSAGVLLLLPSFLRPYLHYLLVPMPFALLALPIVVRALARLPRRLAVACAATAGCLIVACIRPAVLASARQVLVPGFEAPSSWERERRIAEFMGRYVGSSPRIYVLPNSPQYYVYLRRGGDKSGYEFLPPDADVRHALASRVPAFIVDRGEADIRHYEGLLRSEGYRLVQRVAPASAWLALDEKVADRSPRHR
jgi:hypothetical protein